MHVTRRPDEPDAKLSKDAQHKSLGSRAQLRPSWPWALFCVSCLSTLSSKLPENS